MNTGKPKWFWATQKVPEYLTSPALQFTILTVWAFEQQKMALCLPLCLDKFKVNLEKGQTLLHKTKQKRPLERCLKEWFSLSILKWMLAAAVGGCHFNEVQFRALQQKPSTIPKNADTDCF